MAGRKPRISPVIRDIPLLGLLPRLTEYIFVFQVQKCQEGYRLHEDKCVELDMSERCLEPGANFYNDDYSIAQMYRPVVAAFINKSAWKRFEAGTLTENIMTKTLLSRSISCSALTLEVYRKTMYIDHDRDAVCRLFYFDALSFTGKLVPQENLFRSTDLNLLLYIATRL